MDNFGFNLNGRKVKTWLRAGILGGFKYVFIFSPQIGEDEAFWRLHIFQRGWFSSTTNKNL